MVLESRMLDAEISDLQLLAMSANMTRYVSQ
jgi:hypothetical protein